jgi:hypothetical protein
MNRSHKRLSLCCCKVCEGFGLFYVDVQTASRVSSCKRSDTCSRIYFKAEEPTYIVAILAWNIGLTPLLQHCDSKSLDAWVLTCGCTPYAAQIHSLKVFFMWYRKSCNITAGVRIPNTCIFLLFVSTCSFCALQYVCLIWAKKRYVNDFSRTCNCFPHLPVEKWVGTSVDPQVKCANSSRGIGVTFSFVAYFVVAQMVINTAQLCYSLVFQKLCTLETSGENCNGRSYLLFFRHLMLTGILF